MRLQAWLTNCYLGSHPPLKLHSDRGEYIFTLPGIIKEQLTFLRNFRQNNRYIYRHLIDPEVVLVNPREEAAGILLQGIER
jgi:hypothetical protein